MLTLCSLATRRQFNNVPKLYIVVTLKCVKEFISLNVAMLN